MKFYSCDWLYSLSLTLLTKNKKGDGRGAYERGEAYLRGELHRGFTILAGREIHRFGLYKDLKGLPDVSWAVKGPKRSWFNDFFKNGCIVLICQKRWYPFTFFHGQIVPSQIIPLNSHIIPQYSQNFSWVFKPQATTRALLMCVPRSLSHKPKKHAPHRVLH